MRENIGSFEYLPQVRVCYELVSLLKGVRPQLRPQIELLEGVITRAHKQLNDANELGGAQSPQQVVAIEADTAKALGRIDTAYQCLIALQA